MTTDYTEPNALLTPTEMPRRPVDPPPSRGGSAPISALQGASAIPAAALRPGNEVGSGARRASLERSIMTNEIETLRAEVAELQKPPWRSS